MTSTYPVHLGISQGFPRDHHALLIETAPDACHLIQVKGNIQQGMTYESKLLTSDEVIASFTTGGKLPLGVVSREDMDGGRVDELCRALPPPTKQFEGPRRLSPNKKLYRCQEWTADAIRVLRSTSVLKDPTPDGLVGS